jgi:hypothetical protein
METRVLGSEGLLRPIAGEVLMKTVVLCLSMGGFMALEMCTWEDLKEPFPG